MVMSEQRKIYEVARFVLDGADTDRVCHSLDIDETRALACWVRVAAELGQHLGGSVAVDDFTIPKLFQDRLHDCLVYLLNRIEGEKQREILGDLKRPEPETSDDAAAVDVPVPTEGSADVVLDEAVDASDVASEAPPGASLGVTRAVEGPMRVSSVLDEMALAEDPADETVDKPR